MDKEDKIREIEKFIETYDGTWIGESVKRELENADGDEDWIDDLYERVIDY